MAADGLPQIHACIIRVGKLDPVTGAPLVGATNKYTSDAVTKVTVTPQLRDGTEIEEANGCDAVCVAYKPTPSLKWADFVVELCSPDPGLEVFLSGGGDLIDGADPGDPKGYAAPAIGPMGLLPVSVELFAKRIFHNQLDPDFPYAWWTYPKILNLRPPPRNFEVASQKPQFTGIAVENVNYGDGPGGDWPATSDRYEQWVPFAGPLPTAAVGATAIAGS